MQQPAYGIVGQHPAIELLSHQFGSLASQHPLALTKMGLEFVEERGDILPVNISRVRS
jgi:hypothetical protein